MRIKTLVLLLAMFLTACIPAAMPEPSSTPIPPIVIPTNTPVSTDTLKRFPLITAAPFMVDVGGHSLTLYCYGAGSPVVVLEGGHSSVTYWMSWSNIFKGIPPDTRVCAYDRSSSSHTSEEFVKDLHTLLSDAHLEGPYVLVGHSFGGLNVILYADRYPEEVAGVVLEESAHPDVFARYLSVLPPESPEESPELKYWREWFNTPHHEVAGTDWTTSNDQVRAVKSLGDIPLIVLTAAPSPDGWEDLPLDISAKMDQEWLEMQKDLAHLSSNTTHIIATTTNHMIHFDEPQVVIDAILKLVNAARGK